MFSKMRIKTSTKNFSNQIERLKATLEECDAVLIGAGAGLSTSAGFTYSGERFSKYFSDFADKYKFTDMYSGGFYPFAEKEEYWAYWSRYIYINRYCDIPNDVYSKLLSLVKDKDYFVLTTNVDHCFQRSGFDKKRLFYTQGDYGLFQCSKPCCQKTYDNEEAIKKMYHTQKNMRIPSELIPKCPVCGADMSMNLRADDTFVQDNGWYKACDRYNDFIHRHRDLKILFLELGVGGNTPVIIKYPFWQMTAANPKSVYACINYGDAISPVSIEHQSICINLDIKTVLNIINGVAAKCTDRIKRTKQSE